MRGRITMLGISRWSEDYSYKTIERFFDKKIDWLSLKWHLIKRVIGDEVILVADETTVSKVGKSTYGVGYFYSGLQGRAINSIQFLSFSLVDVKSRRAYPLFSKQLKKKKKKVEEKQPKGKVGRPKGSKNKNSSSGRLKGLFKVVNWYLKTIKKTLNLPQLRYFVYDGAFGNKGGIQATKRADLHLISKLKKNSSLYFKFIGEQKSRGRKRKYGELIDHQNMDKKYLKKKSLDKNIETKIYQFEALHKTINDPINVILIFSTNLLTKKTSHTFLFSTDLEQGYEKIIDYYSLRFQIEFNFRDAKQYFGLEDFMNIKKRRLHNFANLSLFMNNVSFLLYKESHLSKYSINDMKSLFMAERYTRETLKFYGQKVDDILISKAIQHIAQFSMIYRDSA